MPPLGTVLFVSFILLTSQAALGAAYNYKCYTTEGSWTNFYTKEQVDAAEPPDISIASCINDVCVYKLVTYVNNQFGYKHAVFWGCNTETEVREVVEQNGYQWVTKAEPQELSVTTSEPGHSTTYLYCTGDECNF